MAMHFIRMRALTDKVIGMYVVRTDTELLEDDLGEGQALFSLADNLR